ncbi:MAG: hypothetical protein K9J37_19425 [Saprospiraceae bacterium]|nr:hypothetical protein [Saprospiraceae bacterium]MCF8252097.1 hypothetical protein [Saprospiraceae bacterium]MCF8282454.1 hypothetical protein [Bacteroidales bacterium]MCF8313740.1 hypothetical protein [Saprospiraceae bacterium]MCF8442452.1 hypothetical protein [Saprospiraceae bacterium]
MNSVKMLLCLAIFATTISSAFGQKQFSNCAAAFVDSKMVVNDYSPTGHCEITKSASGELSVQTANLSSDGGVPTGKIGFRIAIRDANTQTLLSFSDKTFMQVDIKTVLAKCKPGDAIVLLTTDDEFSLPHSEILVK